MSRAPAAVPDTGRPSGTDDIPAILTSRNDRVVPQRRSSTVAGTGPRKLRTSSSQSSMVMFVDVFILLIICGGFLSGEAFRYTSNCTNTTDYCCVRNASDTGKLHKTELYCLGIQSIPTVYETVHVLTIKDSTINMLTGKSFNLYKKSLTDITLINSKNLDLLDSSTFKNLSRLQSLYISHANALKEIPSDIFRGLSKSFLVLRISKTNLMALPDLSTLGTGQTAMHTIEFEGNHLDTLKQNEIKIRAEQLLLEYNNIHTIENWAFNGSEIGKLSLKGNYLDNLSEHCFDGIKNLLTLDLSDTSMKILPTFGLMSIEVLRVENTLSLTTIPSIYSFGNLKEAHLTYSFHCCSFHYPAKYDYLSIKYKEDLQRTSNECNQMKKPNLEFKNYDDNQSVVYDNQSVVYDNNEEEFFDEPATNTGTQEILCGNITPPITKSGIKCWPQPNALNPCEDIMGFYWLRVSVWLVGISALMANLVVLMVVTRKKATNSVPRFLMSNLAFADFCTAVYLLLLAYEDLESSERYFNYAYTWQNGVGCKIGGFLTVFSSQLSVFALCLLTIERWYSIRRALYTTQMTFTATVKIMAFGWVYSIVMATLPLLGISSYSTTSICLPMDTVQPSGMCYVLTLLIFGAGAFLLMLFCYIQIYTSLSYETRNAAKGEASVARKIFVLVGTNFACTAPVIFFGLTALFGYPLIDVTKSKILLVFFYPINSCANPFLYTILTASFRRDALSTFTRWYGFIENNQEYKVIYSTHTNNTQRLTPNHRNTLSITLPHP